MIATVSPSRTASSAPAAQGSTIRRSSPASAGQVRQLERGLQAGREDDGVREERLPAGERDAHAVCVGVDALRDADHVTQRGR